MRNMSSRIITMMVMVLAITFGIGAGVASGSTGPLTIPVEKGGFSVQAWECPSGDFCVWENTGGAGRRCNWSNADPDWWSGSIVCSWADDTLVESAFNNGANPDFQSVETFTGANYAASTRFACLRRGVLYNITAGGIKLRSHRWVTYTC